jgi:ABC-type transporter Mla MlaB component
VRASGSLRAVPAAGRADHLCWVHGGDDDAAFDDAVRAFLAGGLARGERLLIVGERTIDGARAEAGPLTGVDRLVADGTLRLMTLAEAYAATGSFSAERQLEFYDGATRRALAEGYAGLRVVAELTALAEHPQRHSELLRWEHLADRYMVEGPGMTAMCAYRGDLPPAALADVTSVHPAASAPTGMPQFRLFFDDDRLVLAGSIDVSEADRLARLLAGSRPGPALLLDLSRLGFVDVAGCRVIARWAGDLCGHGVAVEIRGASRLFRRVWDLLELSAVASVTFAETSG